MRMKIVKTIVEVVLVFGLSCIGVAGDIYKWVDDEGKVHLTEDPSNIPERYRGGARKLSMTEGGGPEKEEMKSPKQPAFGETRQKGSPGESPKTRQDRLRRIEPDVREAFEHILSLWKDGKFLTLYECGDRKSRTRITKEEFERRMTKRHWELAPSWERVRDVQVEVKGDTLAYVSAKIGYRPKPGGETRFRTQTYPMRFEKGSWRIDLMKLLQDPRK